VVGGLLFGWAGSSLPTDDDLACLSAVGDQVALALEPSSDNGAGNGAAPEQLAPQDQFLSFVAHELRTPLTPMTMLLQSMERKARNGAVDLESITRARRQALRLTKMIGEVIDLSRLNGGRLSIDTTPVDLAELLTDVVGTFRGTTHKHGLKLTIRELPLRVMADKLRLERAILSMLEQAERSSPAGGTIEIEAQRSNGTASIQVSETGGPPSPEQKLWAAGQQPKDGRNTALLRGLNLGLFMANEVMVRHGGALTVEETAEPGLRTVMQLPLCPES
jgi:signal transduction histidine kinase